MHKIKEKLMDELYEVEEKMKKAGGGKLSAGDLEYIHKLTDSIKNIDKICILEEESGYSEAVDWMGEGRIYGASYNDGGMSYARGRRNARRDSMGRYSRDDGMGGGSYRRGGYSRDGGYSYAGGIEEMMDRAAEMMETAENEQQKQAIRRFMKELERM